jgi:VWFA-related protein
LVSLDVAAFVKDGRPMTTLTKEDFHIYEDGALQQLQAFTPISVPINVLLLFDRSGSTQDQWQFMQNAVVGFMARLRPQDRITLAAFDDEFEVLVKWTEDRWQAVQALDRLLKPKAIGATAFYSSVERSVRREFNGVQGRKVVIVFSDGRDTGLYRQTLTRNRVPSIREDRNFERTLRNVRETRTPVYFVAINTDRNLESANGGGNDYATLKRIFPTSGIPTDFLVQVRQRMEQLADQSGGRVFFPEKLADVTPLYEQIGRELGGSYTLSYMPQTTSTTGDDYHKIEVRVGPADRVWQSRTGYYTQR